ncbi:MAG: hypothetical protein F4Y80_03330 [Caldilineaceae bacterium SB0665_bin_21]|nr:hypothetical protein [Caldilineaceae bacterium SB0665_bin_21]MYC63230.1 hypothetical protein [Caldilineaceae bacterium SB0661_bin_34]
MDLLGGKSGRRNHRDEEMFNLLDYQIAAAEEAVQLLMHERPPFTFGAEPLLVLPTGAGKTEIAISVACRLANEGKRVCFLADRKSELRNFCRRTGELGTVVDAEMVQVMESSPHRFDYDVFIVDEAHELRAGFLRILVASGKRFLGLTATPFRRGLQNHYGPIISGPTTNDMVRAGRLVRPRAVEEKWSGDYRTAFDSLSLLGPALAFVPPRQLQVCVSACREAGFSADYIRSGLPPDKIDDAISRFEYGDTQVLVSVAMLSRDYDNPAVRHALDFAKQTSFGLHVQKLSRIMQTALGKLVARYHDFTGNWQRFREARERFWEHGVRDWADVARYQV